MSRPIARLVVFLAIAIAFALGSPVTAVATEYYYVPSPATPTLQDAADAAAASALDEHVIFIDAPLRVTSEVFINFAGNAGCTRRLTIRPGAALLRATIVSTSPNTPIFHLFQASCVTLEDLDILRDITNNQDLVVADLCTNILIHRCRIGSIWSAPGAANWSNVRLIYPTRVMLRNNILFAVAPGTLDHGVQAIGWGDPSNSVLLYNNTISDYRVSGISILGVGAATQLVLLRNNVLVNHPAVAPEPFAFESSVGALPLVVSSNNAALASGLAFVELVAGVQSIFGGVATLDLLPRGNIGVAFITPLWNVVPPGNPNPDFFRLSCSGPLHNDPLDAGQTVGNGVPAAPDVAVTDDIEKEGRPGGPPTLPLHTDRGADQCDASVATGVESTPHAAAILWAAPRSNPAQRQVGVLYRAAEAGTLAFEVFDVAGHRLYETRRELTAGRSGTFEWTGATSGIFRYRLTLARQNGTDATLRGTVTVIR